MSFVRTFAVVPAAGNSRRMGQPKLLLPWQGVPLIDHVLAAWTGSSITRAVVVVQRGDALLAERCRQFDVDIVVPNSAPPDMKTSVQLALAHIEAAYHPLPHDAWLLAPADMPQLTPSIIDPIIRAHDPLSPRIIAPVYQGKRGHPVLFPWSIAEQVPSLPPHEGVNALLRINAVREVPFDDPAIAGDIDTQEDYSQFLAESVGSASIAPNKGRLRRFSSLAEAISYVASCLDAHSYDALIDDLPVAEGFQPSEIRVYRVQGLKRLAEFHRLNPLQEVTQGMEFPAGESQFVIGGMRCLGFCGQSNSLFSKEKEGRSDGSGEGKAQDPHAAILHRGVQAGSGADALGRAFRAVGGAAAGIVGTERPVPLEAR